jgi:hypothetical protein
MMHVCLHDSFGVNYACDFAIHQMREAVQAHREMRDAMTVRSITEQAKRLTFSACHQEEL